MNEHAPIEIAVLGEINIRMGEKTTPLTRQPAAVLLLLALAGGPVSRRELWQSVKGDRGIQEKTIEKHVSDLKTKHHVPIASARPHGMAGYRLDLERCVVDAVRFIKGAERLDGAGPGHLDELMGLWRADPHELYPGLEERWWRPLIEARDRIVWHVHRMDPDERAALARLGAFTACFPHERAIDRIRPGDRKRLLIVDDDVVVSQDIHRLLKPYYVCKVLTGEDVLEQWERLIDDPELDTFHGALIDLHLTGSLNDQRGYGIVEHLRDFTDIPAALVTANAMDVSHRHQQTTMEEYRLVDIVPKTNPAWHNGVREAARLLVDEGEEFKLKRLEIFLASAWREVRRRRESLPSGSVEARRLAGSVREYETADRAVRYGSFEEAERLVKSFRRTWRMRG
ncbi:hypothetical protein OG884_12270 [Streptosporangium sp. NBC_01755]|uniref:hypothetical protein n=1 Tax=Streptosporangium sp. NBC_01755 TaxID=2975949 RepID=UPI002DD9AAB5|nr:hypothetical protein [Streptosporangium sp. NBC_01755]WSD02638.1 hypothetical protein OG884_12270 [Streptosporangium sp. NBC_01755]